MSKKKTYRRRRGRRRRRTQEVFMPIVALIVGGALLLAAAIWFANTNTAPVNPDLIEVRGQPRLKVDREVIDYGDVKLNTNLTFTITLTNVGDKTLRITETPYIEVREGC